MCRVQACLSSVGPTSAACPKARPSRSLARSTPSRAWCSCGEPHSPPLVAPVRHPPGLAAPVARCISTHDAMRPPCTRCRLMRTGQWQPASTATSQAPSPAAAWWHYRWPPMQCLTSLWMEHPSVIALWALKESRCKHTIVLQRRQLQLATRCLRVLRPPLLIDSVCGCR